MKRFAIAMVVSSALISTLFLSTGELLADNIFVLNEGNNGYYVDKFNPSGVGALYANIGSTIALALDSSGNLYNGFYNGTYVINKYTPQGGIIPFATVPNQPTAMAFDHNGNLMVACNDDVLYKVSPSGSTSVLANSLMNLPLGMAIDSAGNIFVANVLSHNITEYTPSGAGSVFSTFADIGGGQAQALAFDSAGYLYAGLYDKNAVARLSPAGAATIFAYTGLDPTRGDKPSAGLAFDSSGNLYVSLFDSTYGISDIERFTPQGSGSLFVNQTSGIYLPRTIVIQRDPVNAPEPATLAMLAIGGAGLLLRRRSLA